MTPRTRTRLLWLLAALTAAHALASVAVFAATGSFPAVALLISLVVYAAILAGALALLVTTPRRRLRRRAVKPKDDEPSARPVVVRDADAA
ncbi:MAG: hypothetical protein QOE90_2671 [Thermoplasmata archaeon]|jgi:hypothetical protein|nr:hypothetical protein [Thermoplasmata archaeon]